MARPQALMEAVSANLNWFLQPIGENLTKPQKKFLRDGLVGLLRASRPVVCRMARKLPDRGTEFISRLRRLEGHLNRDEGFDDNPPPLPGPAAQWSPIKFPVNFLSVNFLSVIGVRDGGRVWGSPERATQTAADVGRAAGIIARRPGRGAQAAPAWHEHSYAAPSGLDSPRPEAWGFASGIALRPATTNSAPQGRRTVAGGEAQRAPGCRPKELQPRRGAGNDSKRMALRPFRRPSGAELIGGPFSGGLRRRLPSGAPAGLGDAEPLRGDTTARRCRPRCRHCCGKCGKCRRAKQRHSAGRKRCHPFDGSIHHDGTPDGRTSDTSLQRGR